MTFVSVVVKALTMEKDRGMDKKNKEGKMNMKAKAHDYMSPHSGDDRCICCPHAAERDTVEFCEICDNCKKTPART